MPRLRSDQKFHRPRRWRRSGVAAIQSRRLAHGVRSAGPVSLPHTCPPRIANDRSATRLACLVRLHPDCHADRELADQDVSSIAPASVATAFNYRWTIRLHTHNAVSDISTSVKVVGSGTWLCEKIQS